MKSTLTPCTLIESWIQSWFDDKMPECITSSWDCQDTECNNETECYFYYPNDTSRETLEKYGKELCEMMGIPTDCYNISEDSGSDDWRIDLVCSISVRCRGGNKLLVPEEDD